MAYHLLRVAFLQFYFRTFSELTSSNSEETFTYDVDEFTMSCTLNAKGITVEKVEWLRIVDNNEYKIEEGPYSTSLEDNVAVLIINDVKQENEGVFKCKFFLLGDVDISERNQVEIRSK